MAFANTRDLGSPWLLPVRPPSTSGSLVAYLGGVERPATGFTVEALRVASVRSVLRTPTVYKVSDGVHDRDRVRVAIQAFDANGSTEVLKNGLVVALTVSKPGESSSVVQDCPAPAYATGMATCEAPLPASWFGPSEGSANAIVALRYSSDASDAAITPSVGIVLARAVFHSSPSPSGPHRA